MRKAAENYPDAEIEFTIERITNEHNEFYEKVKKSKNDTPQNRLDRIKIANRIPDTKIVQHRVFYRNPDVVAEVLYRAEGICAKCQNPAPFNRKMDNTPYLEVHHIIHLADGGEDTIENTEALCPNCHRHRHFGDPIR